MKIYTRKFNNFGKDYNQLVLEIVREKEFGLAVTFIYFDLHVYWEPVKQAKEYEWGTYKENSFLLHQIVNLKIIDAEKFITGDMEIQEREE